MILSLVCRPLRFQSFHCIAFHLGSLRRKTASTAALPDEVLLPNCDEPRGRGRVLQRGLNQRRGVDDVREDNSWKPKNHGDTCRNTVAGASELERLAREDEAEDRTREGWGGGGILSKVERFGITYTYEGTSRWVANELAGGGLGLQ